MQNCKNKLVKGSYGSTGNFKSHYRTTHKDVIPDLERYLDKKQNWEPTVRTIQNDIVAPEIRKENVIFKL